MIKIIDGDIFNCDADAILHQVNCQGVMGSGIAKQVREKFPTVFKYYKARCDEDKRFKEQSGITKSRLLGLAQVCYKEDYPVGDIKDKQVIINLFAQDRYGYDGNCYTDYEALRKCLKTVNRQFSGKRVAIPYLMACHRGGGDWDTVYQMIVEELADCDVTLYRYTAG